MDDRSFVAGQDFILGAKGYWTTTLYPALKTDYGQRSERSGKQPRTAAEVAELMEDSPLYCFYAWLERHLQRYKYSGRYGLIPYHDERRGQLVESVRDVLADSERLELDPDFEMPNYYEAVDIHQHPGGVWSDEIAGFVYERGARSTTPLMGKAHKDLHQRFTDFVAERASPGRVLDMGCGFGKSTRPFYETFRDARVEAVDLSAPCVTLGAHDAAAAQAGNVRFRQMNACETDYEDGGFDLVTSTMVIHELPPKQIERMFDEAARVLEPGGRMVHLDFHILPDAFAQFIHYGHGRRNNEPFMQPWAGMDVQSVLEGKGFTNVEILPFSEAEGVDTVNCPHWRFPWTIVYAEKPAS